MQSHPISSALFIPVRQTWGEPPHQFFILHPSFTLHLPHYSKHILEMESRLPGCHSRNMCHPPYCPLKLISSIFLTHNSLRTLSTSKELDFFFFSWIKKLRGNTKSCIKSLHKKKRMNSCSLFPRDSKLNFIIFPSFSSVFSL